MDVTQMTGLEIMQAMASGKIPLPSICDTMPMTVMEIDEGSIKFEVHADHRHINPLGGVHGGFIATVLDSVAGCSIHSTLPAGVAYGTIDLNVKMLRPVQQQQALIAEGRFINATRRIAIAEGTLKDNSGKLYAHATTTCMLIHPGK